MSKYKFLKSVVVEPTSPQDPNAVTVEMTTDGDYDLMSLRPRRTQATIRADLDTSTIKYIYDWTDDYKRVCAIVGHRHATAVLDALKKPVPANWDTPTK